MEIVHASIENSWEYFHVPRKAMKNSHVLNGKNYREK
jgi:hypothetical protein